MQENLQSEIADLRARLEAAERRSRVAERQGRTRLVLGGIALLAGVTVSAAPQAVAQMGVTLSSLSSQLSALQARTESLESKTRYMRVSGTSTIFRGTNVLVQSGSGKTDGPVNGLGNLVLGYNEILEARERTGSHNLVVGARNGYGSYGGVVFGEANRVTGPYASVTGGFYNSATKGNVVCGGYGNQAKADTASVLGGGYNNVESRDFGWVGLDVRTVTNVPAALRR